MIKLVTDDGFVNRSAENVGHLPLMLFGLLVLRATSGFVSTFSMRWVSRRVVEDLRLDAFRRLMSLPVSYFDANSVGVVTSKLTFNTEQMAGAATKVVIGVVRDTLTILGMVLYMLYLDWRLTMIFATMAPILAIYMKRMTPKLRASSRSSQESMGEMTQVIEEAVSGQRMVKIFGGEDYEYQRFASVVGRNRHMFIRLARISGLNSLMVEMLAAIALGLVVFYAVGKFSAGGFAAYIAALLMLIAPIKSLTSLNEELQVGIAAAQSVFALIDISPEVDEGEVQISRVQGEIEFRNVGLRYDNAKRPALKELSFKIRPGKKLLWSVVQVAARRHWSICCHVFTNSSKDRCCWMA